MSALVTELIALAICTSSGKINKLEEIEDWFARLFFWERREKRGSPGQKLLLLAHLS